MNAVRDWLFVGKYRETHDRPLLEAYHISAMLQLAEPVNLAGIPSLYLPVEDGLPLSTVHLRAGVDFVLTQKHFGAGCWWHTARE